MKSAGTVKHKLSQVRFRHLKKRLEAELRQAPSNCRYNVPMPGNVPNLCAFGATDPESWSPTFCDEREDGGQRAKACPTFCARRTKEQLKEEFSRELNRMSLPEVAARYPDMAALIWVLDEDDVLHEPVVEDPEVDPSPAPVAAEVPVPPPVLSLPPTPVLVEDAEAPPPPDDRPWWKKLLAGAL